MAAAGSAPHRWPPSSVDGFRTTRAVAENARAGDGVGEPVSAAHPDELEITYSLSGADASLFAVDEETGQIMVREGVELALGTTYTVNLTATDSAGFGAIVIVIIEVTEAAFSPYDLNGNDAIERDEVIMAIRDYFERGHHQGRRDRAHQAVLRGGSGANGRVAAPRPLQPTRVRSLTPPRWGGRDAGAVCL